MESVFFIDKWEIEVTKSGGISAGLLKKNVKSLSAC